jgi:hypothetical protein
MENNITCTIHGKHRITATLYTIEMLFSGVQVKQSRYRPGGAQRVQGTYGSQIS